MGAKFTAVVVLIDTPARREVLDATSTSAPAHLREKSAAFLVESASLGLLVEVTGAGAAYVAQETTDSFTRRALACGVTVLCFKSIPARK